MDRERRRNEGSAGQRTPRLPPVVAHMVKCRDMTTSWKIRVSTTPRNALSSIPENAKCLYAISVGPQDKPIAEVVAAYRWARQRFPDCSVLVGDGLYRHTLRAQEGFEPELAERAAKDTGDNLLHRFEAVYGESVENVIRCTTLIKTRAFRDCLAAVLALYKDNEDFAASVVADAKSFSRRQARHRRLKVSEATATRFAIHYLQEEIAVYLLLAKEGWLVDVYLGHELPTLARIIKDEIAGAPEELGHRVNLSLRLEEAPA